MGNKLREGEQNNETVTRRVKGKRFYRNGKCRSRLFKCFREPVNRKK